MYRRHFENQPKNFHSPSVFETGLPEFHKLTLTVLKVFHAKHKPKSSNTEISITLIMHHLEQTSSGITYSKCSPWRNRKI